MLFIVEHVSLEQNTTYDFEIMENCSSALNLRSGVILLEADQY